MIAIIQRFTRYASASLVGLNLLFVVQAQAQTTSPNTSGGEQTFYIDVGAANVRKYKMAVPTFAAEGTLSSLAQTLTQRLNNLLDFTGTFEIQSGADVSQNNPAARPINYDEWKTIKSDGVVLGKLIEANKNITLEMRFYDVRRERLLVGKAYTNMKQEQLDFAVRRFADLIIKELTGELGMFTTKIAFVGRKTPTDPLQLYIANFDGSGLEQISFDGAINMSPAWSPDGSKIAYTTFRDKKAEVYIYNLQTKKTFRLTNSPGNNSGAAWSPDGRLIAFSGAVDGKTHIFTVNALTGSQRSLLIGENTLEVEPAFSPDGKFLAYSCNKFGNPHIFVRDLATKKDTRITYAGWYNASPAWRPDGKKLLFAGYDRDIDRFDIFMVNPDGTELERLTLNQGDNERPTWSPDGRFIIFQSNRTSSGTGKQKNYRLFFMNKDGGNQKPLPLPLYEARMPAWGPRINDL